MYYVAARRKYCIELGAPWGSISVEKNMPSIKFYHDFSAGMYMPLNDCVYVCVCNVDHESTVHV